MHQCAKDAKILVVSILHFTVVPLLNKATLIVKKLQPH